MVLVKLMNLGFCNFLSSLYDVYAFPESEIHLFGLYIYFFSCLLEEMFDNIKSTRKMNFNYFCTSSKC
jgi:hypothetical protein